jgi:hypothetical protein
MKIKKGNSHELPNSIFINPKSNTIMKNHSAKLKCYFYFSKFFVLISVNLTVLLYNKY